jgi:hypothetical protein
MNIRISVADPDHFDADPDPTSEKKRVRILLHIKILKRNFFLKMAYKTYLWTEKLVSMYLNLFKIGTGTYLHQKGYLNANFVVKFI